jgi:hypothetical protein
MATPELVRRALGLSLILVAAAACGGAAPLTPAQQAYHDGTYIALAEGPAARTGQIVVYGIELNPGPERTGNMISVALIPIPGYRLPVLLRVGTVSNCDLVGLLRVSLPSAANWPEQFQRTNAPRGISEGPGARIRMGLRTRCQNTTVILGLGAAVAGQAGFAGIRVVFRTESGTGTADFYYGGVLWYFRGVRPTAAQLDSEFNTAFLVLSGSQAPQP